jgi:hypothetical protein
VFGGFKSSGSIYSKYLILLSNCIDSHFQRNIYRVQMYTEKCNSKGAFVLNGIVAGSIIIVYCHVGKKNVVWRNCTDCPVTWYIC